ncbi:hypothetical protein [Nocardia lijiangensis]|uniref:hypothetical protein n=1 Tax=Nocardia lijiangensis TaxID=299618 RepID=UPI0008351E91|nr:hypothetical protein [Nocardia lijiangensis]
MLYSQESSGVQRAEPAGALATAVALFAAIGAAANLVGLLVLAFGFFSDPQRYDNSLAFSTALGTLLLVFALGYGAVLTLRGDEDGRFTVLVAAGVWTVVGIAGVFAALRGYESEYGIHWAEKGGLAVDIATSTAGLTGTVTAMVHGEWLVNLTGLVLPAVIAILAAAAIRSAAPSSSAPPIGITASTAVAGVTAAMLSTLVGLLSAVGVGLGLVLALRDPAREVGPIAFIGFGVGAAIALLWLLGALLLFKRRKAGRVILIGLSSIGLVGGFVLAAALGGVMGWLPFVLSGAIFCLSVTSPTGRWIASRRQPAPYGQPPTS